ncbi:DNA polymerase III subunit delta [Candidatus Peribacteria bacterium]|nr:DNA polymerase III subunit delta [Candidatus Peribacteria bacterium]
MLKNIFLLTGENAYGLSEERRRWVQGFTQKHGPENCSSVSSSGLTYARLLDEVAVLPFTATKRLVVLEGIPPLSKDEVERLPGDIHPDVILLIIDPSPDKRTTAAKAILALADVRTFTPIKGEQLQRWMVERCALEGAQIAPDALRTLLSLAGHEQMVLDRELRKLCLCAHGRTITTEDVLALVLPSAEQNVWHILDLVASGDTAAVLSFLRVCQRTGESASGMWPVLLWTVAQLVAVWAALDKGARTPQEVMKISGASFGSVRSLLPVAKRIDQSCMQDLLRRFTEADIDLKTGALRATADALQEQEALVDVLLAILTRGASARRPPAMHR